MRRDYKINLWCYDLLIVFITHLMVYPSNMGYVYICVYVGVWVQQSVQINKLFGNQCTNW